MPGETSKETRVDILIRFFQNNKFTSTLILLGITVIAVARVTESGDSFLRKLGIVKSYNIDQTTDRGKFSSAFIENAWNRMFWIRNYTVRVHLNASAEAQNAAYEKYIAAAEKWNSNIMNYYLGLDEYYPNTNKRNILAETIQPGFKTTAAIIQDLRYPSDTMPFYKKAQLIDSVQKVLEELNTSLYFLVDQPVEKK